MKEHRRRALGRTLQVIGVTCYFGGGLILGLVVPVVGEMWAAILVLALFFFVGPTLGVIGEDLYNGRRPFS